MNLIIYVDKILTQKEHFSILHISNSNSTIVEHVFHIC